MLFFSCYNLYHLSSILYTLCSILYPIFFIFYSSFSIHYHLSSIFFIFKNLIYLIIYSNEPIDHFKYLNTYVIRNWNIEKKLYWRRSKNHQVPKFDIVKQKYIRTGEKIGRSMVESVLCYTSEVWTINMEMKRRLSILEMNYLQLSFRRNIEMKES